MKAPSEEIYSKSTICHFILMVNVNSNHGRITCHLRYITVYRLQITIFAYSILIVDPSRGTPININVICASMKSKFSGLQFCHWQYGLIFIHLVIVDSQVFEIAGKNSDLWQFNVIQSHRSKHISNFLLVINSNYKCISYCFWDTDAWI